ncbi:MAG: alkaline phosphatase family protein [Candidatus Micrarchaeota archaeon]|nr:alkaline phosphatase family protein [Candidatus Micrarchaeota archaeon]
MKETRKRFYLIGIDSAPLWIIERLCKNHSMNGFNLFIGGKSLVNIESTVPPVTSAAWPTVYTGLEPKDHGIIDFSGIDEDYGKRLLYYDQSENPPFWDVLAAKGFKSLVMTPAVALEKSRYSNVDMVTGWPLQPRFTSRKVEEACKRFGFEGEPDIGNALNTGKLSLSDATKIYAESTKKRAEASIYLIDRNNYDMSFICFTETDRIQHYSLSLKDWEDYVAPLYEEISDFIMYLHKRIVKLGENAELMIVSDHGAQQIRHKFLSNSWMAQNGYVALKDEAYRKRPQRKKGAVSDLKSSIVNRLVESRFRRQVYSKLPRSVQKIAESFVEESFDYESEGRYVRISESDFDMPRTKAFCSVAFGPMGMIWVNDQRFSMPSIKKGEKERLKREITAKLKKIKSAEKKPLVKNVYDGSKFFSDSGKLIPPDLVFELKEGYTADFSGYSKNHIFTKPEINRRGEHTRMGVFGLKAYKGKTDVSKPYIGKLKLSDVNPIILDYFGVARSERSLK